MGQLCKISGPSELESNTNLFISFNCSSAAEFTVTLSLASKDLFFSQ